MKGFRRVFRSEGGFTLIELLVVIAVISVLAAIAVPRLTGVNKKAIQAEAVSFLGSVKTSLEMYYIENTNSYPTNETDLTSALGQYIDNFDEIKDDWSISYVYNNNPGEDGYEIIVTMEYDHPKKGVNDVVLRKNDKGYEIITDKEED